MTSVGSESARRSLLAAIRAKRFRDHVIVTARSRGWLVHDCPGARADSDPGFFDLVLLRPPRWLVLCFEGFVEGREEWVSAAARTPLIEMHLVTADQRANVEQLLA